MAEEVCPEQCAMWAREYIGYCLCGTKDAVSLGLGLLSVISWGVAEIPQIITNYKAKSTEGLSFAFLLTWIIGDFLNLFGCLLEPATLPTQFYMALLYTVTTLTLSLQAIYYGHIYPRLKSNKQFQKAMMTDQIVRVGPYSQDGDNCREKLINGIGLPRPASDIFQSGITASSPIPLPAILLRCHSAEQDSYYRSARSLSTSHTPTRSSFIAPWRAHTLVDAEDSVEEPLLAGSLPAKPAHPGKTKNLFCVVSALTFVFGTMNVSFTENSKRGLVLQISNTTVPEYLHRKLLQVNDKPLVTSTSSGYGGMGTYMGWGMAAIYVGGRLPQICLNIRRGNVEGLNPFMFIFALLGNTTYVASEHRVIFLSCGRDDILVNSLDWPKIRPNLPWLVDATGCALLDTFILLQFVYFECWRSRHPLSMCADSHTR